jgi:hypothetical protein
VATTKENNEPRHFRHWQTGVLFIEGVQSKHDFEAQSYISIANIKRRPHSCMVWNVPFWEVTLFSASFPSLPNNYCHIFSFLSNNYCPIFSVPSKQLLPHLFLPSQTITATYSLSLPNNYCDIFSFPFKHFLIPMP